MLTVTLMWSAAVITGWVLLAKMFGRSMGSPSTMLTLILLGFPFSPCKAHRARCALKLNAAAESSPVNGIDLFAEAYGLKNCTVGSKVFTHAGYKVICEVDMSKVIAAINANGADLSTKLSDLYAVLNVINTNVIQTDSDVTTLLGAILNAIPKKVGTTDFSVIYNKLDAILNAIKNHEVNVKVTVEGHFTICDKDGNVVHEGQLDDDQLSWLLG